ncbi:MAG: PAS domain S-box protein, partial [Methanosarcina sp.]
MHAELLECKHAKDELIQLIDKLEAELRDIGILHKLSTQYLEGRDSSSIFQEFVEAAIAITKADKGNIQILEPLTGKLKIAGQKGFDSHFLNFFEFVDAGEAAACGIAMEKMERVIIKDITQSSIFSKTDALSVLLSEGIRAVQSTPLVSKSGEFLGMLSTHFSQVHTPTERELQMIDILARQAADIIERKQAEEALQKSEEKYRQIVEAAQEGIWLIDGNDQTVFVNQKVSEMLGCSIEEILGKSPQKFMAPEFRAKAGDKLREHIHGINHLIDYKFIRKDGSERWCILSSRSLFDDQGKYAGSLAIIMDITERKQVVEALQKSEKRYHLLFENMLEGLAYCEMLYDECGRPVDFVYLDTNSSFEKLTGLKEVKGKKVTEVIPGIKELQPELFDIYGRVTSTGQPEKFEIEFKPLDLWLSISVYSPERDRFIAVFDNITERKQIENALKQSETRLRRLYESGMIGVIYFTLEGQINDANDKFLEMVGYTHKDLSAGKVNWKKMTPPEYRSLDEYAIEQLKSTGVDTPYEKEYIRKNGSSVPIIVGAAMLDEPYHDGIAFVLDITERKKVEEALREAYHGLEEKVKERTAELEKAYKSLKESKESLAEAQRMAHLGNWDWNLLTGEVYWSEEMYHIFGRSPTKPGTNYKELLNYIHPKDRDYVDSIIKKSLKEKLPGIDYRIVLANGEERIVHAQAEIIVDQNNTPIRAKGITQDITERKRIEEMLKESEDKLKILFELLPVGVSIIDKEKNILDANLALENILGLSRSDLLNKRYAARKYLRSNCTEMLVEEFPSIKALKEKGSIQNAEMGIVKENGSIIWTDVSAVALPYSDGHVVIITKDITERKKAEEEIQKAEEKYRIVAEKTGQLVYDYNVEKNFVEWAGSIKELTGYTPDEFKDTNFKIWMSQVHPEDQIKLRERVRKYLLDAGAYSSEYRYRKNDGSYIFVEDSGVCLKDEKGKVNRILGVVKNITERKKAEETLAKIEDARKKEIHHRIKNNLQVISSLLDLQAEKFHDREVLEAFKESQNRVISMSLIHEELYKGEGADTLNFSAYLQKLAENLFQTYSLRSKNIHLSMGLEKDAFFNMDVAVPLGIIVNELVSNSLKHAFTEGEEGEIQGICPFSFIE